MAEYILLRISEIARAASGPLAAENCRNPNLFIVFIATPRHVRTWYDTVERTPEGLPMLQMSFPGVSEQKWVAAGGNPFTLPVRPKDAEATLTNPWAQASHVVLNVVWAPRMSIYPHDHRMWAVIGIYGGAEDNTLFRRGPQGLVK